MVRTENTLLYYGTEIVCGAPAHTVDERLGRCYSLAGFALIVGNAPHDAILVHGTIHGIFDGMERIGHAWLQLVNGDIWEPATCNIFTSTTWTIISRPCVVHQYTRYHAFCMIQSSKHWGPWE